MNKDEIKKQLLEYHPEEMKKLSDKDIEDLINATKIFIDGIKNAVGYVQELANIIIKKLEEDNNKEAKE